MRLHCTRDGLDSPFIFHVKSTNPRSLQSSSCLTSVTNYYRKDPTLCHVLECWVRLEFCRERNLWSCPQSECNITLLICPDDLYADIFKIFKPQKWCSIRKWGWRNKSSHMTSCWKNVTELPHQRQGNVKKLYQLHYVVPSVISLQY